MASSLHAAGKLCPGSSCCASAVPLSSNEESNRLLRRIALNGSDGFVGETPINPKGEQLAPGKKHVCTVAGKDIGDVESIAVRSNQAGMGAKWKLQQVRGSLAVVCGGQVASGTGSACLRARDGGGACDDCDNALVDCDDEDGCAKLAWIVMMVVSV